MPVIPGFVPSCFDTAAQRRFAFPAQELSANTKMNDHGEDIKVKYKLVIPDWLEGYESPFLWDSLEERGLGSEQIIQKNIEKVEELKIEELGFSLQRFVSLLKLVLEYYIIKDWDKTWDTIKTIEDLLEKEANGDDPLYEKMKLPLGHVISSTMAFLLAHDNDEEKAKKIIQNVIPVKIMSGHEQAVFHAMKARFYLYSGYENGENIAVNLVRKTLELDPENPEWEYLLAKVLRQQRRDVPFSVDVPREELILLEKAVDKTKNPKFLVYLAQVYRECGKQAFKTYRYKPRFFNSELHATIEDMSLKALNYYKEALDLNPDSPAVLRRVGYGIMNLPRKFADYDLALKCLLRSLEISENLTTIHILGTYYHRFGNDNKKALECFEKAAKAGNHVGISDMIRVKYILDPTYDPMPDFEAALKIEDRRKNRILMLTQQGGYFLFVKRNVMKSIEYFRQAITEDKDSLHLKAFKSFFLRMNETINLYEYLVNEALLLLQKDSSSAVETSTSDDDDDGNILKSVGYVEDFVDMISEIHPELLEITPDPSLIDRLIQTSKEITDKDKGWKSFKNNNFHKSYKHGAYKSDNNRGNHSRGAGSSSGDNVERRGRYSVANQRDRDRSHDNFERRERFSGNQRNRDNDEQSHNFERRERFSGNQRNRDNDEQSHNFERRERFSGNQRNKPNEDNHSNWRQHNEKSRDQNERSERRNWRKK